MILSDLSVHAADGSLVPMSRYDGQVLLVVNTASRCGFTPQYEALEALHRRLGTKGLSVLAFPCNQFGAQEPGDAQEIATFCRTSYDVTFPVFARIDVNGPDAEPLFDRLKAAAPGLLGSRAIKWNFTKFLVSRDREEVRRFAPTTRPEETLGEIERLLG